MYSKRLLNDTQSLNMAENPPSSNFNGSRQDNDQFLYSSNTIEFINDPYMTYSKCNTIHQDCVGNDEGESDTLFSIENVQKQPNFHPGLE